MTGHLAFIDANFSTLDAIARAQHLGYEVSFLGTNTYRKFPDSEKNKNILSKVKNLRFLDVPLSPQNIQEYLQATHATNTVDAVIGMLEYTIDDVAEACNALKLNFTSVDTTKLCRNKGAVRDKLADAGMATAPYTNVKDIAEALLAASRLGYPVILKPRRGAASLLTFKIDNPASMKTAWNRIASEAPNLSAAEASSMQLGMMVEEYLQGEMVSVEIGVQGGATRIYMISGRRRCDADETLDWGIDMPAWIDATAWDASSEYATKVVQLLGLDDGIFHLEIMLTESGPVLVEANCRLMGGNLPLVYQNLTGYCIFDDLFRYFLRDRLAPLPNPRGFGFSSSIRLEVLGDHLWAADGFENFFTDEPDLKVIFIDSTLHRGKPVESGQIIGRLQIFSSSSDDISARVEKIFDGVQRLGSVTLLR